MIEVGHVIGRVGDNEVRSPFAGVLQSVHRDCGGTGCRPANRSPG